MEIRKRFDDSENWSLEPWDGHQSRSMRAKAMKAKQSKRTGRVILLGEVVQLSGMIRQKIQRNENLVFLSLSWPLVMLAATTKLTVRKTATHKCFCRLAIHSLWYGQQDRPHPFHRSNHLQEIISPNANLFCRRTRCLAAVLGADQGLGPGLKEDLPLHHSNNLERR